MHINEWDHFLFVYNGNGVKLRNNDRREGHYFGYVPAMAESYGGKWEQQLKDKIVKERRSQQKVNHRK